MCYIKNLPDNPILIQHKFTVNVDNPRDKFRETLLKREESLRVKIAKFIMFYNDDYWRNKLDIFPNNKI